METEIDKYLLPLSTWRIPHRVSVINARGRIRKGRKKKRKREGKKEKKIEAQDGVQRTRVHEARVNGHYFLPNCARVNEFISGGN